MVKVAQGGHVTCRGQDGSWWCWWQDWGWLLGGRLATSAQWGGVNKVGGGWNTGMSVSRFAVVTTRLLTAPGKCAFCN